MDDDIFGNDHEETSSLPNVVKRVKTELKRLEDLNKKLKSVNDTFRQVALASRLKAEFETCSTKRCPPIDCSATYKRLSDGRCLFLVRLKNCCKETFVGWQLIVQISNLPNDFSLKILSKFDQQNSWNITRTQCHVIPCLKSECTIEVDVYCDRNYYVLANVKMVKCFLAKSFECKNSIIGNKQKTKTFQIAVYARLFTVLDSIRSALFDTTNLAGSLNHVTTSTVRDENPDSYSHVAEIGFTFSLGIIHLLQKETFDLSFDSNVKVLMEWLFANFANNVRTDCHHVTDTKIQYSDLILNSSILVNIAFVLLKNQKGVQMLLELTGSEDVDKMAKLMRSSILVKYLGITFMLDQMNAEETPPDIDIVLKTLTENVFCKLPLI